MWTRRFHKNPGFVSLANDLRNNMQWQGVAHGGGSIPTHTISEGKAQCLSSRQCTSTYNIEAIKRRAVYLPGPDARLDRNMRQLKAMLGISADEWMRVKEHRHAAMDSVYPLMDANIARQGCRRTGSRGNILTARLSAPLATSAHIAPPANGLCLPTTTPICLRTPAG